MVPSLCARSTCAPASPRGEDDDAQLAPPDRPTLVQGAVGQAAEPPRAHTCGKGCKTYVRGFVCRPLCHLRDLPRDPGVTAARQRPASFTRTDYLIAFPQVKTVGRRGLEPRTYGLKVHSSAIELAARCVPPGYLTFRRLRLWDLASCQNVAAHVLME